MEFPLVIRLEKEYTTIKTKEMEEQVEIKVCKDWLVRQEKGAVGFWSEISAAFFFVAAADREPAVEAEDRHARESRCSGVYALTTARQHDINPCCRVRSYLTHLQLMESCLSLTRFCQKKAIHWHYPAWFCLVKPLTDWLSDARIVL